MNQLTKKSKLVSIVTPVYNAENFLESTITSVLEQKYINWELILVDDSSSDSSINIIKEYQEIDSRIKLLSMDKNSGAAVSRNKGISYANGDIIAFLDADDFWHKDKLSNQIKHMSLTQSVFSFTGYEFTDSLGTPTGIRVKVPKTISIKAYLKNNIIWTSTVMIDLTLVQKKDIFMKDLSYGEDALAWINVMRLYGNATGLDKTLSFYRRTHTSLSANKLKSISNKLRLYLNMKELSLFERLTYCAISLFSAAWKRV